MAIDERALADLVAFGRLSVEAADIEPWAATIAAMTRRDVVGAAALSREGALWMLTLYNTTDDLLSALTIKSIADTPASWRRVGEAGREAVAQVKVGRERRNLYGGRILRRMDEYVFRLGTQEQAAWFGEATPYPTALNNFEPAMKHLQRVWGVGRLAAFEWVEFLHKIDGLRVETGDAALWESSGPRQSLERIYARPAADRCQLTDWAWETKTHLAAEGVPLSWWDFETLVCDFNVMRKGRYYPGKHLAMLSEEIEGLPEVWRIPWRAAYDSVVPEPWRSVAPGSRRSLERHYLHSGGQIRTPLSPNPVEV